MGSVLLTLWVWTSLPVRADVINPVEVIVDVFSEKIVPVVIVASLVAVIAATVILLIVLLKRKK